MPKAKKKEVSLAEITFGKVNTVNDFKKLFDHLDKIGYGKETVFMFNDEEGNQTNKVLYVAMYEEGVTFVPHENWENDNG